MGKGCRTRIVITAIAALFIASGCAGSIQTDKPDKPEAAPFALDTEEVARAAADPTQRSAIKADLDTFFARWPEALDAAQRQAFEACTGESCLRLPRLNKSSGHQGTEAAAMVPLWFKACHDGIAEGCMQIARAYQNTEISLTPEEALFGSQDEAKARFFFYQRRACDLSLEHCPLWVDHFLAGDKLDAADMEVALTRAEGLCAQGKVLACRALSRHHARGANAPRDLVAARAYIKRACEVAKQSGSACGEYGLMLLEGEGGEKDEAGAQVALERACGPKNPVWEKNCPDDVSPLGEFCNLGFRALNSEACVGLADLYERRGQSALATRVYAAMCASMIVVEGDHVSRACSKAMTALEANGADPKVLAQLQRRTCEVEKDICMGQVTRDEVEFRECMTRNEACQAKVEVLTP